MNRLENFIDWLLGRPKKPPQQQSIFPQSILDDYDLHMAIQTELNAIKPNLHKLRTLIRDGYVSLGGSYDNAKLITQTLMLAYVKAKLDKADLPIYLTPFRPKIEDIAKDLIGKGFDDFFTDPQT